MKSRLTTVIGITALVLLSVGIVALFSLWSDKIWPIDKTRLSQAALQSPLPAPTRGLTPTLRQVTPIEAALEYQRQFLPSKSGQPQVLLTRSVRFKDYPELGLGTFVPAPGSDPQLELVLLKGSFDTSNYGVTQRVPFKQAAYVVVVYDLEHKAITNVTLSVYGDDIKPLLEMAGEKPFTPTSSQ